MFQSVKTLMLTVGMDAVTQAVMSEYFFHVLEICSVGENGLLAYRLLRSLIEHAYIQLIACEESGCGDDLGIYYQALLDLRNGRPHLIMVLDSVSEDDLDPVQMERLHAMSYSQLANTPVAMTQLLKDNLPQAMAEIIYSELVSHVKCDVPLLQTKRTADHQIEQLRLLQIHEATCEYISCSAATERALTKAMLDDAD